MANFNASYIYQLKDRFSGPLKRVRSSVEKFKRSIKSAKQRVERFGSRMDALAGKVDSLSTAIGGAAILASFRRFIAGSIAVEDALADVARVSDLSGDTLRALEKQMTALSEEMGKSKVGLLTQAFEGLKLGIPSAEIEKFVRLTARTAVAFDVVDSVAGQVLGSLRAKLDLSTDALGSLLDSVNFVADNFAADGGRMIEIVERTSGTMKGLQFPPEVIAGLAGFADQISVTEELAASGLNQIFARMRKNPKLTKQLMTDPVAALRAQFEKFAKADPARRFALIERQFGLEAARFMASAVENIKLFDATMGAAGNQSAVGSMLREMNNRAGRTSTTVARAGVTFSNLFETIGDALEPITIALAHFARRVGQVVRAFAESNPAIIRFVSVAASLFAVLSAGAAVVGVVAAAVAGLTAVLGAALAPVLAVIAAISLAVVAFMHWKETGHPVVRMLEDMGAMVVDVLRPFGELLGLQFDSFGEGLAFAFDLIGTAVRVTLTPLKVFLRTLTTISGTASELFAGNFGAAFDRLATGGSAILSDMTLGALGTDPAETVARQRAGNGQEPVQIEGNITVRGTEGSTVEKASIGLPTGANLAEAR